MIEVIEQIRFITVIEFIGTFAFAISGIRKAATKNYDWFGAIVLGFITAVGGGTLRDLLLGYTPFWLLTSIYVWCTLLALFFFIVFRKYLTRMNHFIFWSDSIGLGLFTVVGAEKAMALDYAPWVIITMGTITGVAGGIIRDVCLNEMPHIFRKEIYAISCILGGICFVFLNFFGFHISIITIISVGVVVFSRYIAVKLELQLPKLKNEERF